MASLSGVSETATVRAAATILHCAERGWSSHADVDPARKQRLPLLPDLHRNYEHNRCYVGRKSRVLPVVISTVDTKIVIFGLTGNFIYTWADDNYWRCFRVRHFTLQLAVAYVEFHSSWSDTGRGRLSRSNRITGGKRRLESQQKAVMVL